MRILAIETSCDETAIAIADFLGKKARPEIRALSHIISSQVKIHAKFGGVVPNLAKREHQKNLALLLLKALEETRDLISNFQFPISKKISKSKIQKIEKILEREQELLHRFKKSIVPLTAPKIDAIAVTYGPGLAPALWVGVNFARALAYLWDKPLIPVNHMAGHLYSAFLQKSGVESLKFKAASLKFPALALLVSGAHTELILVKGRGKFKILGETLDDAAGEAFDKVARMLGLPYPGGPVISAEAERGQIANGKSQMAKKIKLPRPMISTKDYNFSFSGLKTAVLYLVRSITQAKPPYGGLSWVKKLRPAIAKEFQDAVVEVLVKKTIRAAKEYKVSAVLLGGGVAANKKLRQELGEALRDELPDARYLIPDMSLTGDNALMIATAAYFTGKKIAWSKVQADANLYLGHNDGKK